MELFSKSPKSFKIKDKSPVVEKLKSAIRQQLLHLIHYSDEPLTEYIVMLVSKGKHQFRAREDLDAFLDTRSREFVSWLWDLLLQYAQEPDSDIHLVDAVAVKPAAPADDLINGQAEKLKSQDIQFVKHKLNKAEQDISELRSKQLETQKIVESLEESNVGMENASPEDISSRTALVTNVHFAATEDDLFEHFCECGFILDITISTHRSAYITFNDMASVDKAVALSGTYLFFRKLKVIKITDEDGVGPTLQA